jgi:lipopolysaccharide export system protein LptA
MRTMRTIKLLGLMAIIAAVPASGQMLRGHNAKAPVDFDADRIEVQDRSDRVILAGNVKVRQAGLTLDTSRLTVAYTRGGGNVDVERLDAAGGVVVRSGTDVARGNFAIYDLNRRLITMVGGVELNQNGNIVRGGRLLIDLTSGRAVVDGSGVGGSTAPGPPGTVQPSPGGRVSGSFTVTKKDQ